MINKIDKNKILSINLSDTSSDDFSIIRKLFIRIMLVQIAMSIAPLTNTLVDGIIAGMYLSENDIAAIQLQSVIDTFVGLIFILTEGGRILLTEYIGRGQKREITELVSTLFFSLLGIGTLLTAILSVFCVPVARILGAEGECIVLCAEYVKSSAFGIVPRLITNLLINLAIIYHLEGASYLAAILGMATNTGMDVLFVGKCSLGISGMGLATSISYFVSFLVMMAICRKRIRFGQQKSRVFNIRLIPDILKNGLPIMMITLGILLGNYGFNLVVVKIGGMPATAATVTKKAVIMVAAIVTTAASSAFAIIGGILYNEKNRKAVIRLFKMTLRFMLVIISIILVLTVIFRENITQIYFSPADEAYSISKRMLLIVPMYFIFYIVYILFFRLYQIEKRIKIVNILALIESPGIALCSLILGLILGLDGVWAGYIAMNLICIITIWCYSGVIKKQPCFKLEEMMLIPSEDEFGIDYFSISVKSKTEVLDVSKQVMEFFNNQGYGKKLAYHASLCIEEIAGNIVEHGFSKKSDNTIIIRMFNNDDHIMISIRDDCMAFDPVKRLKEYDGNDPVKNVGIRLISGIAEEMRYIDTLGLNTLVIRLKKE